MHNQNRGQIQYLSAEKVIFWVLKNLDRINLFGGCTDTISCKRIENLFETSG